MKSSEEQLQKRGFINDEQEKSFPLASFSELLILLNDKLPIKRTVAARRLGVILNPLSIEPLCIRLEIEKALYCKLEICNTLTLFGKLAVPNLIQRLGLVDNNQYKIPPQKKFGKKNYPLPHDIFARILMKIGSEALPCLCQVLVSGNLSKLSEAIDAIGYICFYDTEEHSNIASLIKSCYYDYANNDLIRWKLIRAMSAFKNMLSFLKQECSNLKEKTLKQEAERSLEIIRLKYYGEKPDKFMVAENY